MKPRRKANSNLWLEALLALSKTLATLIITHLSRNDAEKLRLVVLAPSLLSGFGRGGCFRSSKCVALLGVGFGEESLVIVRRLLALPDGRGSVQ